ncbi:MAG: hypothetical protein GKR90_10905 [Pseudomonadales bacterium]|nr:hypothetical protein [Pseudomonadales bacterium]
MPDFHALGEEIDRFGWLRTVYRIGMDRCDSFLQLYEINSRPFDINAIPTASPADEIRFATEDELQRTSHELPDQLPNNFLRGALVRGDKCLAAFVDGKIVSFTWRAYGDAPHINNVWIRVKAPYRYSYKAYTRPEYRGQRIMDVTRSDAYCIKRGRTRNIGFIATHNFPSLRSSWRKANRVRLGYAGYFTFFGRHVFFRTPGVKLAGFEFVESRKDS